jgi:hypothetical protein
MIFCKKKLWKKGLDTTYIDLGQGIAEQRTVATLFAHDLFPANRKRSTQIASKPIVVIFLKSALRNDKRVAKKSPAWQPGLKPY